MSVYFVEGKGWRVDFLKKKVRYTETWFKTKVAARNAEAAKRKELENPVTKVQEKTAMGFLELVNRRLDHVKSRNSGEYYKTNLLLARKWVVIWDGSTCNNITQNKVDDFLLTRKKVSAYTANKELRHLRATFNFGVKKGLCKDDPTKGIDFFPVEKIRRTITSRENVNKVINAADLDVKDYLIIISDTMARVGEVNRLTWDDVDFNNKTLFLYTRKKRGGSLTPRNIPMTERIFDVLSRRNKVRDSNYSWVFCNTYVDKTGTKVTTSYKYRPKLLNTLCKAAGVKRFSYHDLRRLGASIMNDMGVELNVIQEILGHENRSTTEEYLYAISKASHEAIAIYEAATKSHT